MLNTNSIILKVTLLFIFSFVSFLCFVAYFISVQNYNEDESIKTRYSKTIDIINDKLRANENIYEIHRYLLSSGFYALEDENIMELVAEHYLLYYRGGKIVEADQKKILNHNYIVINDFVDDRYYIYTDYIKEDSINGYYIFALLASITLVFFYVLVLNSLLPLLALRKEVQKFASGNLDIQVVSNNDDEISELSMEFKKAAYTINEMNKARVLFLRSIMHELKTPITKGRIVTEMLSDAKAKERLINVFVRLNAIIDDFAKIEEMSTKNYRISKTQFSLSELMSNINKMLLIEDERPRNVILESRDSVIFADFDAMSLSVKNLIDNASKHSSNQKVIIYAQDSNLVIKNQGEPLKDDINKYFQPFYNDGSQNEQRGLGLGMYIIKNTLTAQGFRLEYVYEGGFHYFYIKDCIIETKGVDDAANASLEEK